MNVIKKRPIYIVILLGFSFILTACGQKKVQNNELISNNVEAIKVQNGAVLLEENGKYNILNLIDGKYSNLKNKDIVIEYNKESGTYIFMRDGKHYIYYKGKEKEIADSNYNFIKISPDGNYVSYMVYNNGYNLKVVSLKDDKEIKINSKVAISGEFYDFIDKDNIVYYGVSSDNINGVFTFNLKTGREELLYKLDSGYAEFLKGGNDEVIILQQIADNKRVLKKISKENKKVEDISNKFEDVKDIVDVSGTYYVLGSAINDAPSVYKINKGKVERLVYSFPSSIDLKRGLSVDQNGNILFIGSNSNENNQEVFSYKDGSVSIISSKEGRYDFIKIN
ncbi:hypothetical protein [Clostridium sardiniense]|uniref:hypothetical protein n=1 Tax=Clostridium sardiniense TaxID=29369 RepID=UPI003D329E87